MSKRPSLNSNFNQNNKKSKLDFDHFKPPIAKKSDQNSNQIRYQNNPKPQSVKISIQQQSITDKIWPDDDEDDEVLLIASQSVEDQDRLNRQQQLADHNESYSGFMVNAETSSTQHRPKVEIKTGYTEIIRNDLFIDLTGENLQNNEIFSQDSQKENFEVFGGTSKAVLLQMKELQKKLDEMTTKNKELSVTTKELREKLLAKEGEAKNLRLSKKSVEDELKKLRIERLETGNTSKFDPEKENMRKELNQLRAQKAKMQFNENETSFRGEVQPIRAKKLNFFVDLPEISSNLPEMSGKMFEIEEFSQFPLETRKISEERKLSFNVLDVQMKLAQIHSKISTSGHFSDFSVDEIFTDACSMIFHISSYIEYLSSNSSQPFTFDYNPALTAAAMISVPDIRQKLTKFDPVAGILVKNGGKFSIFSADKIQPDEICAKPRRIIAFYSSLAKHSVKFSEKLLLDNIANEENHRTFVSVLVDSLVNFVSQSDEFYEYSGFVIAVGSLLDSLGSHYGRYTDNAIIDIGLGQLFHAILLCRCDNPMLMAYLSKFLADISSYPQRTNVISKFCVNFPSKNIVEISRMYKHFEFPADACHLQLFFTYLLTSFRFNLNTFEIELLMKTLLNLNRLTSNILELPPTTMKFMARMPEDAPEDCCGCLQQMTNLAVSLSYLAMVHRNKNPIQLIPRPRFQDNSPIPVDVMEFLTNHTFLKELAKRGVFLIQDLFRILEPITEYPLNILVFSNRLEQFYGLLKTGKCKDTSENFAYCRSAFRFTTEEILALDVISLSPNLMTMENVSDNEDIFDRSEEEQEQEMIAACKQIFIAIDEDVY